MNATVRSLIKGGGAAKVVAAQPGRMAVATLGWLCIAAGAVLAVLGFVPLLAALRIIGGHSADPQGDMDGMIAAVKARWPFEAVGFGLLVLGAILEAAGKGEGRRKAREAGPVSSSRRRCALCGSPVMPSGRMCSGGHEQ